MSMTWASPWKSGPESKASARKVTQGQENRPGRSGWLVADGNADGHPDAHHAGGADQVVPEKRNWRGQGDDEDHDHAGDQAPERTGRGRPLRQDGQDEDA